MPVTGVGIPLAPPNQDPLPIEQGGTAGRTPGEARKNLNLPSLSGDNDFTGQNTFTSLTSEGASFSSSFTLGDGAETNITWASGGEIYDVTPPRLDGHLVTASAEVALEAQTGAIGATTMVTDALGKYLVVAYVTVQAADAGATSITVNAIYTDPQGARTKAVISALSTAATTGDGGQKVVNVASGNLQFSVTLGGAPGGTLDYDLEIDVLPV